MIKIKLSESQRKEIEKLHWEWFEKRAKYKLRDTKETYKDFILNTLDINEDKLKEIIIGEKSKLDSLKERIGIIDKNDSNYKKLLTVFGYDHFSSRKPKKWNAYIFCQKIGVDVCPYCNRQYIFTVKNPKSNIARPEIDHFYPKSKYPYLSCSLYNFVPSCHICNHLKSNNYKDIMYPYEEEFGDDGKFKIHFADNTDFDAGFLTNPESIKVNIKPSKHEDEKRKKIKTSISVFHLEEMYNNHKLDLNDLLQRYRNYSKPKIHDILKMLVSAQSSDSQGTKNEIIEESVRFYTKAIKNTILGLPLGAGNKQYPLKKFKEDIIEQLDCQNTKQSHKV